MEQQNFLNFWTFININLIINNGSLVMIDFENSLTPNFTGTDKYRDTLDEFLEEYFIGKY